MVAEFNNWWLNKVMQKNYFHDRKHYIENKVQKKTIPLNYIYRKRIVDINKLLNRVRLEKKSETKRKIVFYSTISVSVLLFGFFIF